MAEGLIERQIRIGEREELAKLRAKLRSHAEAEQADARFESALNLALKMADASTVPPPKKKPTASTKASAGRERPKRGLIPALAVLRIAVDQYPTDKARAWELLCIAMGTIGMARAYALAATKKSEETSTRSAYSHWTYGEKVTHEQVAAAARLVVQDSYARAQAVNKSRATLKEMSNSVLRYKGEPPYPELLHLDRSVLEARLSDARLELGYAKRRERKLK